MSEQSGTTHTGGGNRKGRRAAFGSIRKLASGNWQARYTGPDGAEHRAPVTFQTKGDARAWLSLRQASIVKAEWTPEVERRNKPRPVTFGVYSASWLASRPLKPRTRSHYASLLRDYIGPTFDAVPLREITPPAVRGWHSTMPNLPTTRAHSYALLKAIMKTAVDDDLVTANPCRVRGAGQAKRAKKIEPLTVSQLNRLANAMPPRLRMAVLLGCWCALRYGELSELRRSDVDLSAGTLRISRGVVKVNGAYLVGDTKTDAGLRTVHIPLALAEDLELHLSRHVGSDPDGLLFPAPNGGHLHSSSFARDFHKAAVVAGRPDATPHTLRHTGASLATSAGATTADVMARLGHSTPAMAMHYQHSLDGADERVARKLSQMAEAASGP